MLKAVIFDLDGTIILNNEAYDIAFTEVLKRQGIDINEKVSHVGGIGVKSNWEKLIYQYNLDSNLSLEDLEKQTQEVYLQNINTIKVRDGFTTLVDEIKRENIKTALATGNDKETTQKILSHFGFEKYFDAISTIYEAGKPKPEPDIFLLAAERLSVEYSECVVIEDSDAGIEAAHKAGMPVVSVHDFSFTDLSVEKLQSIANNH